MGTDKLLQHSLQNREPYDLLLEYVKRYKLRIKDTQNTSALLLLNIYLPFTDILQGGI